MKINPNPIRQRWQQHEGVSQPRHLLDGLIWRVYGVDDALVVASLAATAASTGAGMAANRQNQKAVKDARNAELLRQQDYQRRAQAVAAASQEAGTRPVADEQIQQGADKRSAAYARITAPPTKTASGPTNRAVTSAPTATATAQSNAVNSAWNRILGGAQSRLGGYQDWNLTQAIKNRRAAEQLGTIGNAARGSAMALEPELQDARHAGDGLNMVAGLLDAGGQMAGTYAAVTPRGGTVVAEDPYAYLQQNGYMNP